MKIRLISDLHCDINHNYPLDLHSVGYDDVFTFVAGDVSGSPKSAARWLRDNISYGAFVSGNHDVYDSDLSIEEIKKFFAEQFPASSNVTYLDYEVGVF